MDVGRGEGGCVRGRGRGVTVDLSPHLVLNAIPSIISLTFSLTMDIALRRCIFQTEERWEIDREGR